MSSALRVIEAEPAGAGIIERLESALELARAGQLSSCAIAVVFRDGFISAHWSDAPNISLLIGAIERLKHRVIAAAERG